MARRRITVEGPNGPVKIWAPTAPSPGGLISVVDPETGETFTVENPKGALLIDAVDGTEHAIKDLSEVPPPGGRFISKAHRNGGE